MNIVTPLFGFKLGSYSAYNLSPEKPSPRGLPIHSSNFDRFMNCLNLSNFPVRSPGRLGILKVKDY